MYQFVCRWCLPDYLEKLELACRQRSLPLQNSYNPVDNVRLSTTIFHERYLPRMYGKDQPNGRPHGSGIDRR